MSEQTLTLAFAVWAAVVGMIGIAIVWELSRLRSEVKEMVDRVNRYVVQMERRVTHIEATIQRKDPRFRPALVEPQ